MPRIVIAVPPLRSVASSVWSSLKNAELHRVAVLIGASCSGIKSKRIQNIEETISGQSDTLAANKTNKSLSLVSIDVGIRNLAYAHLSAVRTEISEKTTFISRFEKPKLEAWKRLNVSSGLSPAFSKPGEATNRELGSVGGTHNDVATESFEPSHYATHAYNFVQKILATHQPTHILIERQRFRSGGAPAVQEWTIRVGMFEAMLYAVLNTLAREREDFFIVQGVLPAKVNRYWLEEGRKRNTATETVSKKLSGKEAKMAKIDIVRALLMKSSTTQSSFNVESEAEATVAEFAPQTKSDLSKKSESKNSSSVVKLDDLADCLLQGLAWIDWQNNIARAKNSGLQAFNLSSIKRVR